MSVATSKAHDTEYEDGTILRVDKGKGGWSIEWKRDADPPEWSGGLGFWVPDKGVKPRKGQRVRFYGQGFGYIVRGLDIAGREVFYRTPAQQAAKDRRDSSAADRKKQRDFGRDRADHDRRIAALPDEFRRRLEGFQSRRADWRRRFEGYELMVCEDAVRIAGVYRDAPDRGAAVEAFQRLDWEKQLVAVPGLDEGHSGNSFGAACNLAALYLTQPKYVEQMHGALCPLVGCQEYGCWNTTQTAVAS